MTTHSDACSVFTQRLAHEFPRRTRIESFLVAGLTRRIGDREHKNIHQQVESAWGDFFDSQIYRTLPNRTQSHYLYAVYSASISSLSCSQSLTVGAEISEGPFGVRVEAGDYLVFSGPAGKPECLDKIWHAVKYYLSRNPGTRVKNGCNFERYTGPHEVELFVGIA